MKQTAVLTDATSAAFFFPRFTAYYGKLFGRQHLHVVTYAGMAAEFANSGITNIIELDAGYDDTLRARVISELTTKLLERYEVIIRADIDEFIIPDRAHFADLADYVERNELPYVTAHGVDVIELADDEPLQPGLPVLGQQRRYGIRAASLNKTCLTTVPIRWANGFHACTMFPRFGQLYNFHYKFADINGRIAWHERMLAGLPPGSPEHKYFSHGAEHLLALQRFLSTRPRQGEETERDFAHRFLDEVGYNKANQIYQGPFISQDFLFEIDAKFAGADEGAEPGADESVDETARAKAIAAYDGAALTDPPEGLGVVSILEAPKHIPRILPALVTDLSGRGLTVNPATQLYIHGTYLVQHEAVLLFGGNHLVSREGHWSCEARAFKEQYLSFYREPFFDHIFPGPKPVIDTGAQPRRLRLSGLTAADVEIIDAPVFLATPVEPANWGRWVVNVIPKTAQFLQYGGGRKFLCHVAHPWQRRLLNILGVPDDDILPHDPGRSYICEDLLTVEYSVNNFTVSAQERTNLFQLVMRHAAKIPAHRKLFVSRASLSAKHPHYRVLQNEAELTAMLEALGFVTIEPETLPFEQQVALFAGAEQIVCLGGSAIFNAAFCPPGISILDIESSAMFANSHADFLASLGARYGVVFGTEDETDQATHHKRWRVDVPALRAIVAAFFE